MSRIVAAEQPLVFFREENSEYIRVYTIAGETEIRRDLTSRARIVQLSASFFFFFLMNASWPIGAAGKNGEGHGIAVGAEGVTVRGRDSIAAPKYMRRRTLIKRR